MKSDDLQGRLIEPRADAGPVSCLRGVGVGGGGGATVGDIPAIASVQWRI